jgi:hypothetical protein
MRMRGAEVRVEDPELQGTQYVGASNSEEILTLAGPKGMHTSSAAASARVKVQGTLESSEVIVLSSAPVTSTEAAREAKHIL